MASITLPGTLSGVLETLGLDNKPFSWTLQETGNTVTVHLSWVKQCQPSQRKIQPQSMMMMNSGKPRVCQHVATSSFGHSRAKKRKSPSKLRRDRQRLEKFLQVKRSLCASVSHPPVIKVSGSPEIVQVSSNGQHTQQADDTVTVDAACQTIMEKADVSTNTEIIPRSWNSVATQVSPENKTAHVQTTNPVLRSVGCQGYSAQNMISLDKTKHLNSQQNPNNQPGQTSRPLPSPCRKQQDKKQTVSFMNESRNPQEIAEIVSYNSRYGDLSYTVRYTDGQVATVSSVPSKFPRLPGWT